MDNILDKFTTAKCVNDLLKDYAPYIIRVEGRYLLFPQLPTSIQKVLLGTQNTELGLADALVDDGVFKGILSIREEDITHIKTMLPNVKVDHSMSVAAAIIRYKDWREKHPWAASHTNGPQINLL